MITENAAIFKNHISYAVELGVSHFKGKRHLVHKNLKLESGINVKKTIQGKLLGKPLYF